MGPRLPGVGKTRQRILYDDEPARHDNIRYEIVSKRKDGVKTNGNLYRRGQTHTAVMRRMQIRC